MAGRKKREKEDIAIKMSKSDFINAVAKYDGELTILNRNLGGAEVTYVMKKSAVPRVRDRDHLKKMEVSRFVWMSGTIVKDDIALFLMIKRGE